MQSNSDAQRSDGCFKWLFEIRKCCAPQQHLHGGDKGVLELFLFRPSAIAVEHVHRPDNFGSGEVRCPDRLCEFHL